MDSDYSYSGDSLSSDPLSSHSEESASDDEHSTVEAASPAPTEARSPPTQATPHTEGTPPPNSTIPPGTESPELTDFRQRLAAVGVSKLHPLLLTSRSDFPPPFPFPSEDAIMEWGFPRFDGEPAEQRTIGLFLFWLSFLDPECSGIRQKRLCRRFKGRYHLDECDSDEPSLPDPTTPKA